MHSAPQLSVIIPTYNRADLIGKTVESVLAQTFSDQEILVVDDGSTDGTEETIQRLLGEMPERKQRIRYLFQGNQGKSVALNYGIAEARGAWIAFLDSDDQWLPTKMEKQFRALRQYAPQSEACFTDARFINNPPFAGTAFEHAGKRYASATGMVADLPGFVDNPFGVFMQTLVTSARLARKVGGFDPSLWVIQDLDFVFRVALETTLCFVNAPLVLIDRTPKRAEGLIELLLRNEERNLREQQRMYEKWLRLADGRRNSVGKAVRGQLRGIHSQWANWHLLNKRYREARHAIAEATRARFTPGTAAKWCLSVVAPALARSIVVQRAQRGNERHAIAAMGCGDPREQRGRDR